MSAELGRVLVTGASGKLGRVLVARLLEQGARVRVLSRSNLPLDRLWPGHEVEIHRGDLAEPHSLRGLCAGIDSLFHLASHAPAPHEPDLYAAPGHWRVSAEGTAHLMAEVAKSELRRLVYLSTVKALGDALGARGAPASESLEPAPETLYGQAKLAAERALLEEGARGGRHAVVLRLPMVYGLDGAGNLARMVAAIEARRFPPWPRIDNHRSAVHVEDAIDAAFLVARETRASGRTYCATDGQAYSTAWIYERTLEALGRPLPRWRVPPWLLRAGADAGSLGERLLRRRFPLNRDLLDKLLGDAWFSSAALEHDLGFRPRFSLAEEIERLVRGRS